MDATKAYVDEPMVADGDRGCIPLSVCIVVSEPSASRRYSRLREAALLTFNDHRMTCTIW